MDPKKQALLDSLGTPMSLLEEPRLLRAMFYGDPDSGKTDLVAKIAYELGGKALLISSDDAWTTILKYPDIAVGIHKYDFDSFGQVRLMVEAHNEGIPPYSECNTFIWDTVSDSVDQMLRFLVDERKYPKEQHDPEVEGWPHYRLAERALLDTVKVLHESDLNIIYTAHQRFPNEQDAKKQQFAVRPTMPEACFRIISRKVQLIGWQFKESAGEPRQVTFEGTKRLIAKSQISGIEEITYLTDQIPVLIKKWVNQ